MANFILIPGFWLGAWAWREVTPILRAAGHEVYPLTLTGLGERVHLGGPEVDLETHAADVVNAIEYNELDEVYLAGHSYAGIVITQVADLIPEKIAKLIYVDSAPIPDGAAQIDFFSAEQLAKFEQSVNERGDGWALPLPAWEDLDDGANLQDLTDEDRRLIERLATPQPFNAPRQPVSLKSAGRRELPKLAIWCEAGSDEIRELIAQDFPLFAELKDPNFEFVDLPTGHYPMFTRPRELAEILLRAAAAA